MKPLLVVNSNRYHHLIIFPFAAGLTYLFFWLAFISEDDIFDGDPTGKIVLKIMAIVGLLLCFLSLRNFFVNKPALVIYEDGFIANTHGVASHKVLWTDIKHIEETDISVVDESPDRVLAIHFKNPDYFAFSKSKLIGKLAVMGSRARSLQTGEFATAKGAPMLIPVGSLKAQYERVKQLMQEKIIEAKGHEA